MEAIGDQRRYQACVWMTRELQAACAEKVRDMLHALTMGRSLRYSQCDMEKPGFPFAPHDKWLLAVDEWTVTADTREEAECKMLGLILRDGIGFPLFRSCANSAICQEGMQYAMHPTMARKLASYRRRKTRRTTA